MNRKIKKKRENTHIEEERKFSSAVEKENKMVSLCRTNCFSLLLPFSISPVLYIYRQIICDVICDRVFLYPNLLKNSRPRFLIHKNIHSSICFLLAHQVCVSVFQFLLSSRSRSIVFITAKIDFNHKESEKERTSKSVRDKLYRKYTRERVNDGVKERVSDRVIV